MFTEDRDKNDCDGSSPPTLSDQELGKLKNRIVACLPSTQRRRREPHFLTFRVCVDGQELGQFTPEARVLSLTVPADALRLQICGQDAEGELPLALFYLPDFLEEATPQRLYAVLEGGATFEVVMTPVVAPDGTMTAGRVDLQFWAEEAQVRKTSEWYEAAVTATGLSVEVARLAGDQRLEAALLARLGDLYQAQDQPADALAYWQASVTLARHMGNKELEAVLGAKLAAVGLAVPVPPPEATWEPVALATALQQAQQQVDDPAWRARLAHWQTRWAGKAQAAARLVVQAADEAARMATEGLEALTTPGTRWEFALASVRETTRGRGADRDVSRAAAGPGPAAPQVSIQVGQASHEATKLIQVSVRALPAQPLPPLVLLIPATGGGVPHVAALAPLPGSAWLIALFYNVPQGDYLLAFEPMEDINPP